MRAFCHKNVAFSFRFLQPNDIFVFFAEKMSTDVVCCVLGQKTILSGRNGNGKRDHRILLS